MSNIKINILFICCLLIGFTIYGCASNQLKKPINNADDKTFIPGEKSQRLSPGLDVTYVNGFWRHINEMPGKNYILENGDKGKPIRFLNHQFGRDEVFDSGRSRGVGVLMQGYIHLEKPGMWKFKARSNDGLIVFIGSSQVVDDPEWHSDRFSKPMEMKVSKQGFYSFLLQYFQRKGTATLEFYWKPPGENKYSIVPESAFFNVPGK